MLWSRCILPEYLSSFNRGQSSFDHAHELFTDVNEFIERNSGSTCPLIPLVELQVLHEVVCIDDAVCQKLISAAQMVDQRSESGRVKVVEGLVNFGERCVTSILALSSTLGYCADSYAARRDHSPWLPCTICLRIDVG